MRRIALVPFLRAVALASLTVVALASCGGKVSSRSNTQPATNIPATFDMTLLADKDGQFDMDGATLTEEDVKGNLRYRVDQGNPVKTILLKRAEKQKVSTRHLQGLGRIGMELHIQAFVQEKPNQEIAEIRVDAAK
ncbi:MAG: hypothetical protein ABI411_14050 [Tahibacter sp.]